MEFLLKTLPEDKKKDIFEKDVSNNFTRRFIHHENPLFTMKVNCLHTNRIVLVFLKKIR